MIPRILIQPDDFDPARELEMLGSGAGGAGALVSFTGLCRDEGGRLAALELEHYPGMAEEEVRRVVAEASARWPLAGLTVIHRHGLIPVGGRIVFVGTAALNRKPAFAAAEFLMDYLKTRAPFWKREHLVAGSGAGRWVAAREDDDRAADRWSDGSGTDPR